MNDAPRVPAPVSAVALTAGGLPATRDLGRVLRSRWPEVRVGERRPGRAMRAERSVVFVCGLDGVGAAGFPFRLQIPGRTLPEHASHVWLSVRGYDRARRNDALRLLARATAAVTRAGEAAFVWWSVGEHVLEPAVFLASVEQQA